MPDNASPNREKELFEQASDIPSPAERAAFLRGACGDDTPLRQRLEALLLAVEAPTGFLPDQPRAVPAFGPTGTRALLDLEKPGDQIGPYKLREKIGEGGCGVVYVAEQLQPVRRWVALKVIKLGMDTRSVIARFDAEREALARMDHPNIARVLDAGATATGRPYFVMELVRGIPINAYCDQNNLPTAERLDLFIKVCHAVQHAHQKAIIHRDLKPSNILVTLHDGVPVPKVIDFGIAKATEGRLTDLTVYTELHQFIGTPAYTSPEQAEMSGLDIDTRSDIYSLGVLLYELLTGKTPFDAKELIAAGLDEMRRTIREKEPPRPSTRLSTMVAGELTATAKHRSSPAPLLVHQLRGDLDWVVMKCLEKDRARRYETATGLGADIQRYLGNEAVLACPPSAAYLLQKLVRRHKLAFAAGAAVAAALIVGLGLSTWLFVKEKAARQRAAAAEGEQKHLAIQLGNLVWVLLDAPAEPGRLTEGETMLRNVLPMQRKLFGDESEQVIVSLAALAEMLQRQGKLVEAETPMREAMAVLEKEFRGNWMTLYGRIMLGRILFGQKKYAEVEPLLLSFYESIKEGEDIFPMDTKTILKESLERLVQLSEAKGDPAQAAEWKQKLAELP